MSQQTASNIDKEDVFSINLSHAPIHSVVLHETHLLKLTRAFKAQYGNQLPFSQPEPVIIDLSAIADSGKWVDFPAVASLLRNYNLDPIAMAGGNAQQIEQARAARMAVLNGDLVAAVNSPPPAPEPPRPERTEPPANDEPVAEAVPEPALNPDMLLPPKILRQPVRSGAEVYARQSDLVIISMVGAGARVVADGSIYIHGPLKGTAAAGVSGMGEARIFCESFEPEIIAINGVFLDGEQLAKHPAWGKRVLVELDQDQNLHVQSFD